MHWRCDERAEWTFERIGAGVEALEAVAHRERARADFLEQALKWALGEDGLPVDEDAEWSACVWYTIWRLDDERDERLGAAFERIRPLLVTELREVPYEEPSLRWPEVVGRLWLAYRMRVACRLANAAQRAIVDGDAVVAVDKLQDAAEWILVGQEELDEMRGLVFPEAAE